MSRVRSIGQPPNRRLAALVLGDGRVEVVVGEVRPELVAEDQLGVGRLPEQEVARALVAAGPDHRSTSGWPAV